MNCAITQDPALAPAHAYLALTHLSAAKMSDSAWQAKSEVRAAWRFGRQAIRLDERDEHGAAAYALACSFAGRHEEAVRFGNRAAALNPAKGSVVYAQAMTLFYAGAYEAAVPIFERIIQVNPEDPLYFLFYEGLAEAQYGLENYTAAFDAARQSLALKGGMIPAELLLTATSAHLGMKDVAYDTIKATSGRPQDLAGRVFGIYGTGPAISGRSATICTRWTSRFDTLP